ncbi:MAG TPA: ABC transporter permease [Solirubrobacteraceae bacterium]|nr:ABC transporter permease [Solirubrobacteraceae bacterium]
MAVAPTDVAVPGALEAVTGPSVGPRGRWRSRLGLWIPAGLVALIFFLCFVWPLIGPVGSPTGGNILEANLPIGSPGHVLGTDAVGNDEWARLLYGGRASLEIALAVNALGIVVGGLLGAVAAYLGGWRDATIMRFLDVFIAFPALVLALAIAEGLGPSEVHVIWALAFFSVPAFARLARAETLRIRELNFITAAGLSGTGHLRTLLRHVMPNIVAPLMTFALLGMGIIIVLEGALSFLGLGIPPPAPSWGNMISSGESTLSVTPRYVFIPSIALFITVVSFNLLGDALRSRWSQR